MPLYEYQCDICGHKFELIQKFSDPPVETCQECGGTVHKLLSSPAIQFKGSGWYVTDYGRKGASSAGVPASSNGSGSSKAVETSSGGTETKTTSAETGSKN